MPVVLMLDQPGLVRVVGYNRVDLVGRNNRRARHRIPNIQGYCKKKIHGKRPPDGVILVPTHLDHIVRPFVTCASYFQANTFPPSDPAHAPFYFSKVQVQQVDAPSSLNASQLVSYRPLDLESNQSDHTGHQ
jgi:hypothetical protein